MNYFRIPFSIEGKFLSLPNHFTFPTFGGVAESIGVPFFYPSFASCTIKAWNTNKQSESSILAVQKIVGQMFSQSIETDSWIFLVSLDSCLRALMVQNGLGVDYMWKWQRRYVCILLIETYTSSPEFIGYITFSTY